MSTKAESRTQDSLAKLAGQNLTATEKQQLIDSLPFSLCPAPPVKPGARNPKPGTRNLKPETRNPEPGPAGGGVGLGWRSSRTTVIHKSHSSCVPGCLVQGKSPDVERTRGGVSPGGAHLFSTAERNVALWISHLYPKSDARIRVPAGGESGRGGAPPARRRGV